MYAPTSRRIRLKQSMIIGLTLFLGMLLLGIMGLAKAQTPVTTYPLGQTSTNGSSTIASTNTFQSIFAANATRRACVVQNTGTHVMYVFFGALASATISHSFPLYPASQAAYPGGFVTCNISGVVATDQVSITGTAGDTFTAVYQ